VAFNRAGTLLASYGWDNTPRLWSPHTGKELLRVPADFFEFSPDGRTLAYLDGTELGLWEVADDRACRALSAASYVRDLQFHPGGRLLAAATDDGVDFRDPATGARSGVLPLGPTLNVLFDPGGSSLVTARNNSVDLPF
jgi:WD40 repeat protein